MSPEIERLAFAGMRKTPTRIELSLPWPTREENVAMRRKREVTTEALRQFVNEQASERAYEAMRIALGVSEP